MTQSKTSTANRPGGNLQVASGGFAFVTEIVLVVNSSQEKELLSRFQAGRQLYNALLNEAMVRMELVRDLDLYQKAKKYPARKDRDKAFSEARKVYRYTDYDLQACATLVSNRAKWIAQKVDSNTQQKLATRAFAASEKVLFGSAKTVRYKVPSRFHSMEGKTNKQGIRWKEGYLIWGKLKLKGIIDSSNPVISHGLNSPIKYVRLLWRELNGLRRWYAQLINEGIPYQKLQNYVSNGVVGLDLNISNIAFVADNYAGILPFAQEVPTIEREIKALQSRMQRSQRASDPDNYQPSFAAKKGRKTVIKKGKTKKGKRKWNKSKSYIKTAAKKRELERKKAAYTKSQNRKIVNDILRHGNQIKTENVSVKGWQKRYGKAVSAKSPGLVQSELVRKAENAGGRVIKFSTCEQSRRRPPGCFVAGSAQKTALSQTHLNGQRIKKSLSNRVHYDVTGAVMHRDLFSAYLSRFVNDENNLLLHLAVQQWERSEPILMQAWKEFQTNCERVAACESRLSHSPLEQFCTEGKNVNQIANKSEKLTAHLPGSAYLKVRGVAQWLYVFWILGARIFRQKFCQRSTTSSPPLAQRT